MKLKDLNAIHSAELFYKEIANDLKVISEKFRGQSHSQIDVDTLKDCIIKLEEIKI